MKGLSFKWFLKNSGKLTLTSNFGTDFASSNCNGYKTYYRLPSGDAPDQNKHRAVSWGNCR